MEEQIIAGIAARDETCRAPVRDVRLMTDWPAVLASTNPLRKG